MLSSLFIASVISAVFADHRNFMPLDPNTKHHHLRAWVHLNPKCFPTESDAFDFKDYLLSKYDCIDFDNKRTHIYKHAMSANYSVWSLWLEPKGDTEFECLSQSIDLPSNIRASCIDNVYYEPLQFIQQDTECVAQPTNPDPITGGNLWSLDILDGTWNLQYVYTNYSQNDEVIEAIILDTDIDYLHPEFDGLNATNMGYTCRFSCVKGHGTHVAGTVVGNNVGGAKHTNFNFWAVCQLAIGCGFGDIEQGYEAAIALMEANPSKRYVINFSVGGLRNPDTDFQYDAWGARINANGGIWVVASGNSDEPTCDYAPAFSEYAISVSAYDGNEAAASFSNYGSCTDVWAPGVNVYSSMPDNSYGTQSGTSMASPNIASMVISLLKRDNSMTLQQLKDYMNDNARQVNSNGVKGVMNQAYIQCED